MKNHPDFGWFFKMWLIAVNPTGLMSNQFSDDLLLLFMSIQ